MSKTYDVIIIGAGAAGLMAAIEAGKRGRQVLVLDKARKAGKKILISGGGRCNFTNMYAEAENYLSQNPHFMKSALARYTQWDFIGMVAAHGIDYHEKTLGQLFCDDKATQIVAMLLDECASAGVEFVYECDINQIEHGDECYRLASNGGNYRCASLIIATGGLPIPRMGSSDFGLHIARQFGLKTTATYPGLVPFTFAPSILQGLFKDLAGLSLEVVASCGEQSFRENLLFTHRGLSGPVILQISSFWRNGDNISLNLMPDADAREWLIDKKQAQPNQELKTALTEILPKRLALRFCEQLFENVILKQLEEKEINDIAAVLNDWQLTPSGSEGYRTAEVMLGGVKTDDLSSKTMEAKQQAGLYFIGEVVDVTGWLGGFNFQWAWASGWVAGQYA